MKSLWKFLLCGLLLLSAGMLTGCGGASAEPEETAPAETTPPAYLYVPRNGQCSSRNGWSVHRSRLINTEDYIQRSTVVKRFINFLQFISFLPSATHITNKLWNVQTHVQKIR